MLSICSKFDAADNKFDVKMVAPSLVEEVGDYIFKCRYVSICCNYHARYSGIDLAQSRCSNVFA